MFELILVFIILLLLLKDDIDKFVNKTKVRSKIDGREYYVSNKYDDKQQAADILARVNKIAVELMRHLRKKYKDAPHSKRKELVLKLLHNYNPDVLIENVPLNSNNTSYVKNKGDEMGVCLREKDSGNDEFHDQNIIEFVTIHELTHIASKVRNHPPQFWSNFKFMLQEAKEAGIHKPKDYSKNNINYCGLLVTYNPYFDPNMPTP